MKNWLLLLGGLLLLSPLNTWACEVCESKQPKILKGITHGSGPTGTMDYIITWSAVVIVGVTLYLSIKYLIKPKETAPDHIKNITVQ